MHAASLHKNNALARPLRMGLLVEDIISAMEGPDSVDRSKKKLCMITTISCVCERLGLQQILVNERYWLWLLAHHNDSGA